MATQMMREIKSELDEEDKFDWPFVVIFMVWFGCLVYLVIATAEWISSWTGC